jgi:hypothetical protein
MVPKVVPRLVNYCSSMERVCVAAAAMLLAELTAVMTFANPKSSIFARPRFVTKMFAGLMSRWTTPAE